MTPPYTLIGYLILQTFYVRRPGSEPHYQIELAHDEQAPRLILLTRDEALYQDALTVEGTPQRVDVAWKPGRRPDGRVAQVLCALRAHREAA